MFYMAGFKINVFIFFQKVVQNEAFMATMNFEKLDLRNPIGHQNQNSDITRCTSAKKFWIQNIFW